MDDCVRVTTVLVCRKNTAVTYGAREKKRAIFRFYETRLLASSYVVASVVCGVSLSCSVARQPFTENDKQPA